MKNSRLVLLDALFKSTGSGNILKYSKDPKKRKQIKSNLAGHIVLYVFLFAYAVLMAMGYGVAGLTEAIPATVALTVSLLGFIFTMMKTNGYLFAFKEYDMLMSMPIPIRTIVADKFLYMYINSLPILVITSVSMMVGYGIYAKPAFYVYIIWTLLSLMLPMIPMVIASALGALLARIGSGFKYKKAVQSVLLFAFILACVFSRFFIEKLFRNGEVTTYMGNIADTMNSATRYYPPAAWFTKAVTETDVLSILAFVVLSIGLLELMVTVVAKSYRRINSALMSGSVHTEFKMGRQKGRSAIKAVAFKEFRRMLGSTTYLTNAGFGEVLAIILGVAAIFVDGDKIVATIFQGAPITKEMMIPAIPFIIYFLLGMVATTCCTPSLEGKNYWIVQSLPISRMDLYRGKMLFNMYFTMPFMIFASITLGISFNADLVDIILFLACGTALLAFSTTFGMMCGLKHIRLDWENEIEVIKQGAAVTLYIFPNMFITMIVMVGVVFLGFIMPGKLVIAIITVIIAVLAFAFYKNVINRAKKEENLL